MKHLKMLGVAVAAALILTAIGGAGSASATRLCKNNLNPSTCSEHYAAGSTFNMSLEGSLVFETIGGTTLSTCTAEGLKGKTQNTGAASESVNIPLEEITWGGCTASTTTVSKGSISISQLSGTDNATVTQSGSEWTMNTSFFGACVYGSGTGKKLGTLMGGSVATLQVSTTVTLTKNESGSCPSEIRMTANYTVTEPKPLYAADGGPSTLCKNNTSTTGCTESYAVETPLDLSLATGSSLKVESGSTTLDSCTSSTIKAKTNASAVEAIIAPISEWSWGGCTVETKTLTPGELEITHIGGSDNGTVKLKKAEITINTGFFGACTYGGAATGTDLGTLTGGSPATLKISTSIPLIKNESGLCPSTATWTAEWTATEPKPLYVADQAPTRLCKNNTSTSGCTSPYPAETTFDMSLKSGTAMVLETTGGTTLDTCTGSTAKGKTGATASSVGAVSVSLSEWSWSGCTVSTTTIAPGQLEISHLSGTDNGTVNLRGFEMTANTGFFGACTYGGGTGGVQLGTLSGGAPASLKVSVVLALTKNESGFCPSEVRWTAEWTATEPNPLYVADA
jgi:hypothetical protein